MLDDRESILDFNGGLGLTFAFEKLRQHRLYYENIENFLESERTSLSEAMEKAIEESEFSIIIQEKCPHYFEGQFQSMARASFVILLFSFVESLLDQVARDFKKVLNSNVSHKDFWGSSFEKSKTFLVKVAEFKNPLESQWDLISRIHEVRNALAHSGGSLNGVIDQGLLKKILENNVEIKTDEEESLFITREYCSSALKNVEDFIKSLQGEAIGICYRVNHFEKRV